MLVDIELDPRKPTLAENIGGGLAGTDALADECEGARLGLAGSAAGRAPLRVEIQLGLFQEQRATAGQGDPQTPHEPKRPARRETAQA